MKTIPNLTPALVLGLAASLAPASAAPSRLEAERELLKQDPARAAAVLQERLAASPQDPWLVYNTGVAAYAAGDFTRADDLWQQLASSPELPEALRAKVWLQTGNVTYRRIQPLLESDPEAAIAGLEQSREALRAAVGFDKDSATAVKNLRFVESELEKILARLARQLTEEAKKEGWAPRAVEKLEAALPRALQALELNPQSPERQEQKKEIESLLAAKLQERAAMAEKTADERQPEKNEWEKTNALENYSQALADYQQAQSLTPEAQGPKAGEARVREKIADLFNKTGHQEKNEARQMAEQRPDEALEQYQEALDDFQQALAVQPEHAAARAGEKETREAMEQLHLRQGDRQMAEAEQQRDDQPAQAARNARGALANFQAAQAMNPDNPEIQPRIDRALALQPELLTRLALMEQRAGAENEVRNQTSEALEHYGEAEQSFSQAAGMQPDNQEAKQGQKETREAIERLRREMAKAQKEREEKPNSNSSETGEPSESFESMLARVRRQEQQRETQARHRQGEKYREQEGKALRNW